MTWVFQIAGLGVVFAVFYLITFKAAPFIFIKTGRALGFKMKPTPLVGKRIDRFRHIKRGYLSFVFILTAFVMSFALELFINNKPLYIRYGEKTQYPAVADWFNFLLPYVEFNTRVAENDFGLLGEGNLNCRKYAKWIRDPASLEKEAEDLEKTITADEERFRGTLIKQAKLRGLEYDPTQPLPEYKLEEYENIRKKAEQLRILGREFKQGKAAIIMPILPYSPNEQVLELPGSPPHMPFQPGFPMLGTDDHGREIISQLFYGFRICFAFALFVAFTGYAIGMIAGAWMGYYGGWFDIFIQRAIEVWSSIPFLFTLIIISSIIGHIAWQLKFIILALLHVALLGWTGITYTLRGEFYRERSRDYVQAAKALGVRDVSIMFRHILPNALVPIVTYLPFSIVGYMGSLVMLDFLGYGLPPGTPSWGALLQQGADNIVNYPHLVYIPVLAFAGTLFCVVMVGEAVREAFDPKRYARLR